MKKFPLMKTVIIIISEDMLKLERPLVKANVQSRSFIKQLWTRICVDEGALSHGS